MRYENEQCAVCSERFEPEDDIVVCPECGTPMHRNCWNENNGCPNAERHGEFTWTPSAAGGDKKFDPKSTPGTICPRCGNNCAPDMLACPNCGMQLASGDENQDSPRPFIPDLSTEEGRINSFMHEINAQINGDIEGVKVVDIVTFVQANPARIVTKFKRINKDKKVTWNWGAFIFAEFWFIYRKMFKIGIIMMAISLAISIFRLGPAVEISKLTGVYMEEFSDAVSEAQSGNITNGELEERAMEIYSAMRDKLAEKPALMAQYTVSSALLFIKHIISGLIGYWVYRKQVLGSIKELRQSSAAEGTFRSQALRRGGVSVLMFALSLFVSQLILDLLTNYAV